MEIPSGVLPAIRKMKDFESALESSQDTIVLLETRISQLKSLIAYTRRAKKRVLLHVDLVQGLRTDEYAMEFLIREMKPDGILSTRSNVIGIAKKHGLLSIQRMFLLDSLALDHNLELIDRTQPDCIEVLPGLIPDMIRRQIHEKTNLPVIAGGLIKQPSDIERAMAAGAVAVSTSEKSCGKNIMQNDCSWKPCLL
ncbi:glycerol-3-phosphate responsive antiterminator [Virgibacillus sp. 179-BFC.A HS]|uniref:Glycerol uptake operon antiterminator regulatory protein n=1 Tax=Tigheibacillus jepli TaxID=3035914 RepID=A0ABU5CFM0_9BACI|nr:glycerol-3-phosphate responsive antiterminator [Virgibacillus sp. 179-BFC.A HS]MDY0405120.1 glycerol-3-phosphate responsive antiterminator [Virgibacillus sp. 179-BFC.A HS]